MELVQFQRIFDKEPKYRLKQANKALFRDLIGDWQEATVFPFSLREELNKKFPVGISAQTFSSQDKNTVKALFVLDDGLKIETILMRHKDKRNTVCVSSQVGCPLGCSFCATGKTGFRRNLNTWEIIKQILFMARYLRDVDGKITNIVFMGMGEPFLNYQSVMDAIKILNDKDGFNLGARHFSISTVGVIEGIEMLAKEGLQVNLAVSLHAPTDELRSKLIPLNKKYSIDMILGSVDNYIKQTRRRVMFEYIMIKDLNDSDKHAELLAKLTKKYLYFVNLISYNPTGIFKPSSSSRIKRFKEILEKEGVVVTQRHRFGQEVEGACGQLAAKDHKK